MEMSPGKLLRQAVADGTIQVPGAFNALVARMIEAAGFEAAYISGAAFSAGALAVPDVGLFTLTELGVAIQVIIALLASITPSCTSAVSRTVRVRWDW